MFEIPSHVFDTYNDAVDAMIDVNFGVNCIVQYPAEKTICSNCEFNPNIGKSANIYKSGGTIPFTDGLCPYCNGDGYTDSLSSDTIKLRCYYTSKNWVKLNVDFKVPSGSVQVIGHMSDILKIRRANYIILNSNETNHLTGSYRLLGEPVPHGFKKNKFFIAFLERLN